MARIRITTKGSGLRLEIDWEGAALPAVPPRSPDTIPGKVWEDGTPIWFGEPFPEPWGTDPRDRWVRVMAEIYADCVWDVSGVNRCLDELPVSRDLLIRAHAWTEWHDAMDAAYSCLHRGTGVCFWEEHPVAPLAAFNAEGEAIATALRDALPADWSVVYAPLRQSYG
jgi:hypothetical protein